MLSCLCLKNAICSCFDTKKFTFDPLETVEPQELIEQSQATPDEVLLHSSTKAESDPQEMQANQININSYPSQPIHQIHDEDFYEKLLSSLNRCQSFEELRDKCMGYREEVGDLNSELPKFIPNIQVDKQSVSLMPNDLPGINALMPARVSADGNCLPRSGSVHAYGDETHPIEMRARIVIELVTNEDVYMDSEYLRKGEPMTDRQAKLLPASYTMYSDEYIPGTRITDSTTKHVFQEETMKISQCGEYMGIWQLFALASVLKRSIYSVYPHRGSPCVRKHLHRKTTSRVTKFHDSVAIMWTSTRSDMVNQNWIPNHFVPLVKPGRDSIPLTGVVRVHVQVSESLSIAKDQSAYIQLNDSRSKDRKARPNPKQAHCNKARSSNSSKGQLAHQDKPGSSSMDHQTHPNESASPTSASEHQAHQDEQGSPASAIDHQSQHDEPGSPASALDHHNHHNERESQTSASDCQAHQDEPGSPASVLDHHSHHDERESPTSALDCQAHQDLPGYRPSALDYQAHQDKIGSPASVSNHRAQQDQPGSRASEKDHQAHCDEPGSSPSAKDHNACWNRRRILPSTEDNQSHFYKQIFLTSGKDHQARQDDPGSTALFKSQGACLDERGSLTLAQECQTPPSQQERQNEPGSSVKNQQRQNTFLSTFDSSDDLLDEYVIIIYDGLPYPGVVVDVDFEDVKVQCMHRVGHNRFSWPGKKDICWHKYEDILAKIPPPTLVNGRHHQVLPDIWDGILKTLDL